MSLENKDQYPYIKIGSKYYSREDFIIPLGKALIKKGLISKSEILDEL